MCQKKDAVKTKLTILVENCVGIGSQLYGEAGLAMLIECEGKKILLDTGYSDLFLRNARQMGVELSDLEMVALSHGHNDHTSGLDALAKLLHKWGRKIPVVLHPTALEPRRCAGEDSGFAMDVQAFEQGYLPQFARGPVALTERLIWLGEIPRRHDFEDVSCGVRGGEPDFLPDDTALVYRHEDGLVVLTGCAHSGICNIVDYAMEYTGDNRILDIVGGFHLPQEDRVHFAGICAYLRARRPAALHPCHCTGLAAKIELARTLPVGEITVGTTLEY